MNNEYIYRSVKNLKLHTHISLLYTRGLSAYKKNKYNVMLGYTQAIGTGLSIVVVGY